MKSLGYELAILLRQQKELCENLGEFHEGSEEYLDITRDINRLMEEQISLMDYISKKAERLYYG